MDTEEVEKEHKGRREERGKKEKILGEGEKEEERRGEKEERMERERWRM
jgi:hypothetical protein